MTVEEWKGEVEQGCSFRLFFVNYIPCERRHGSRDLISVSAALLRQNVVSVNYIQYETSLAPVSGPKNNLRENSATLLSCVCTHTPTHIHICNTENKFNVVTSFKAVSVKDDYWQSKVIRKPQNKNKFGA